MPVLVEQGLLVPLQPRPHPDPLPKNFDPNAKCLYHQNNGHWTDRCWPFRHAIQDLIEKGKVIVIVQDTQGTTLAANIMRNPLPTHAPQSATPSNPVNTLDEAGPRFDPLV